MFKVTAIYAGLLALMMVFLAALVVRLRGKHRVTLLERSDRQGLADHGCPDQISDIACFAARSPSSQAVVHSWNPDSSEWPKRTLP